jgi:peptidoglycan/xylan/chitin deacetylase (PgdA/CDA1 family)
MKNKGDVFEVIDRTGDVRKRHFNGFVFAIFFIFLILLLFIFFLVFAFFGAGEEEENVLDESSEVGQNIRYTTVDGKTEKDFLDDKKVSESDAAKSDKIDDNALNNDKESESGNVEKNFEDVLKNGKTIYLTFDDGPSQYTAGLLDVLKKYNVKASFFVTCAHTEYRSVIKRAFDEGHTIGLHSCTHDYARIYSSVDAFLTDLNNVSDVVKDLTGKETKFLRFPGGSSNTVSRKYSNGVMTKLVSEVTQRGYIYFDWNVLSGDADGAKTKEQVFSNVTSTLKNDSIVLQHDTKGFSVDAVEDIIKYGLKNGYTFSALNEKSPTARHRINN